MVKKTQWIWCRTNQDVRDAFLFNCRKHDLVDGLGISKGTNGFVAAEAAVPKVIGKTVAFRPNRRCAWQGLELRCLAKTAAPDHWLQAMTVRLLGRAPPDHDNFSAIAVFVG